MYGKHIIHLASNVSPDLFPNNRSCEFSTILAEEIDLSNEQWEVAAHQITYPTHVSTITDKDTISVYEYEDPLNYKHRLPYPKLLKNPTIQSAGQKLNWNFLFAATDNYGKVTTEAAVNYINHVYKGCPRRHLYRLSYIKEDKKFHLTLFRDNIVMFLEPQVQEVLGFKHAVYGAGVNVADSTSTADKIDYGKYNVNAYLLDLEFLEKETHELLAVRDTSTKQQIFEKTVRYKFTDEVSQEAQEACFLIRMQPELGLLKIKPVKPIPSAMKSYHKKEIFFRFDKKTTEQLKLRKIYLLKATSSTQIRFAPFTVTPLQDPMQSSAQTNLYNVSPSIEIFYLHLQFITRKLSSKPIDTISIAGNQEIAQPKDLIPLLNEKHRSYLYQFAYDESINRYTLLQKDSRYALSLSKSLATLLGFDPNMKLYGPGKLYHAKESPILDRAISNLYIYSNIVQSTFVGDVKGPLLVSCAYKRKNKFDSVTQYAFANPVYIPLHRSRLQKIDISVYDDAGELVPFLNGKLTLTLILRRCL